MTFKPAGNEPLLKRYPGNPIIPRNVLPASNSVLNSAVVRFGNEYRGVFRVDNQERDMCVHATDLYERVGDVPNVAFPCAALHDPKTDELRVYYGAADTCVCMATTTLKELIAYVKAHDMIEEKKH